MKHNVKNMDRPFRKDEGMLTVQIVEDEMLVRMGLQVSVPWEKYGLTVSAEASNGAQAFELYQKNRPDIVITDLCMPGLNGIELIRKIRDTGNPCAIIVITCMDKFELLKEAMALDVVDYLVKATMTISDIEKALQKAKSRLSTAAPVHSETAETEKARLYLLNAYVLENTVPEQEWSVSAKRVGIQPDEEYYALCISCQRQCEMPWQLQQVIGSMLKDRLESLHVRYVLQHQGVLVILLERKPNLQELRRLMEDYRSFMQEHFSVEMSIVLCTCAITLAQLPTYVRDACAQMPTEQEKNEILLTDLAGGRLPLQTEECFQQLRLMMWQTVDYRFAIQMISRLDDLEARLSSECADFCQEAALFLDSMCKHSGDEGLAQEPWLERLGAADSAGKAAAVLQGFAAEKLPKYRSEIQKVISAIVEHPEHSLSLNDSAALVSFHPQYLSHIFKKEVGIGYSEFVNTVRITLAKRMICSREWSLQQIAEKCGFSDTAYFNRCFKTMTGMTPGQWRRRAE